MTIANDKKFGTADRPSEARRRLLQVAMSSATLDLFGCCNMRDWAKPEITLALRPSDATIFKPATIYKSSALPKVCIDVHTHFFNASDVPVKGFLEGPIAHAMPSLAWLIRLLGPIAEGLSEIAPSAAAEYAEINDLERSVALFGIKEAAEILDRRIATHRKDQSLKFFDLVNSPRGKPFLAAYDKLQAENRQTQLRAFPGERARSLDEGSLTRAMVANEIPLNHEALRIQALPKEGTYAEGILGFIGYMLSYRWSNLLSYQKAFSTHENSLGMDRVLSALVDFDRWLECPPRSSHEDQMRLFDLISRHSDRYMLPLIGYNPWTDAVDEAKSPGLERVKEAIKTYNFVGVKIYPPNGFLPYGKQPAQPCGPDPKVIERVMKRFWDTCVSLDVPVMSHAGPSMGSDDAHDQLGGPGGWEELAKAFDDAKGNTPRVNLGHFGGDGDTTTAEDWTRSFADKVMLRKGGKFVYGDLGFWDKLACGLVGNDDCNTESARKRLKEVLSIQLGNGEYVADRVMYGSDWHMLSRIKHWSSYARELSLSINAIDPAFADRIFGGNAQKLFTKLPPRRFDAG